VKGERSRERKRREREGEVREKCVYVDTARINLHFLSLFICSIGSSTEIINDLQMEKNSGLIIFDKFFSRKAIQQRNIFAICRVLLMQTLLPAALSLSSFPNNVSKLTLEVLYKMNPRKGIQLLQIRSCLKHG